MRLKVFFLGFFVLTGCGGGGSDGGQPDQTFPEPAIFRAPLEPLPAATLTSEEGAVILSGGWTYHYDSLLTVKSHTNHQIGNRVDVTQHEYRGCLHAGENVTEGYTLEDLGSPFTGALHSVRSYRLESCDYDLALSDDITGFRQRGFPVSGKGSGDFFEETDFLSYDRYGDSSEQPHFVYQQSNFDNSRLLKARYSHAFVHLSRNSDEQEYGSTGLGLEEFSMERFAWIYDNSGEVRALQFQLGESTDARFRVSLYPIGELPFPEHRIQRVNGAYGARQIVPIRESCPEGLITVVTLSDIVIDESDIDPGPSSVKRAIKSGQIELQDAEGNKAVITMDGDAEVWSVSLNGGAPVDFSFEAIQLLEDQRCGS